MFVVAGAVKDELREGGWRDTYKLWEEAKGPGFVLEVTSRGTRGEDQVRERALYARLGVEEYFMHDSRGEYLSPPLQGMVLRSGGYEALGVEGLSHGAQGGGGLERGAGAVRMPSELGEAEAARSGVGAGPAHAR